MSERQIDKLKRKFILTSTACFFTVMLLMGGFIYIISEVSIRNEALQVMAYIVDNDGELPQPVFYDVPSHASQGSTDFGQGMQGEEGYQQEGSVTEMERIEWSLSRFFGQANVIDNSLDFIYSTRYFAVLFDTEGEVEEVKTAHISRVNEDAAVRYASFARKQVQPWLQELIGDEYDALGRFGHYYYEVADRDTGGVIVVFLDRTSEIYSNNRILMAALILIGFGTIVSFLLMGLFSRIIVKKEVDNVGRQKQFITNASHELKTPLAVIRGNTEMQEMLTGETEWTASTLRQVERMDGLIKNLVMIARSQEVEDSDEVTEVEASRVVRETAQTFDGVARSEGKTLDMSGITDGISLRMAESKLRQLTSLLTDNAVKYCDADGRIGVALSRKGRYTLLEISNSYAEGEGVDYERFFERFYRADESHNSADARGGFGIGLLVAEDIVRRQRGTISAAWRDGVITFTCRLR